ncbi:IGBP1 [Acanthosepion pharaonis]|uniref:IGBP1 n=1 Tax=Acanthosepion pharaonis TaxID=158019 RepID=A0A812CZ34_ACAPH|nr:IGBP1 [Sepia pharaonis]
MERQRGALLSKTETLAERQRELPSVRKTTKRWRRDNEELPFLPFKNTEKAIHMTNLLHLFSDNEDIDEVSTPSLKYLLLPALLNYFTMRKVGGERLDLVKKAKRAVISLFSPFFQFLSILTCLLISSLSLPFPLQEPDLLGMANQRQNKIDRYKEQKKTLQEIKELRVHIEKEHVEEEVQRKYYLLLLKNWISTALDDFENIKMELEILKQMAAMKAKGIDIAEEKKSGGFKKKPFRPFIITKDQLQKKVIGAGYPSLPTMTVEEFYEQKVKDGTFQLPTGSSLQDWATDPDKTSKDKEEEERNEEAKIEKDDAEKLSKMRNWDDWKDDVRRGDGNRMNMG